MIMPATMAALAVLICFGGKLLNRSKYDGETTCSWSCNRNATR